MKNRIFKLCFGAALTLSVGCNDFLETETFTSKTRDNFPATQSDMESMIAGVYSSQHDTNDIGLIGHPYLAGELASDERYGSSGSTGIPVALDKLMIAGETNFDPIWKTRYEGIYRANMAIEDIDKVKEYKSEEVRNQFLGEAYFLRATYYWDLAQLFETVPLKTTTEPVNLGKATPDELYAQMGSDLIKAIELLPNKKYNEYTPGHATRWAAEGYLARIYLFYCGIYKSNDLAAGMPLLDSGTLTKEKMAEYLQDCIDNSGHSLVPDYRNLWTFSNEITKKDYKYSQDEDLKWAGENNSEVMYKYTYSTLVNAANNMAQRNYFVLSQGYPGGQADGNFPYGAGWGTGWVHPKFLEEWKAAEPDDTKRQFSTIIDVINEVKFIDYGDADDPNDTVIVDFDFKDPRTAGKGMEYTGYRNKKHSPIRAKTPDGKIHLSFGVQLWGALDGLQKANIEDMVMLRFADVLLMHSELTGDATNMNKVRARAGLTDKPYSLENLQAERRWELSFEGVRWNDIRRWGIAADMLDKQVGQTVWNEYKEAVVPNTIGGGYKARYEATRGFFPIPKSQIDLSNGLLKQNKGWEAGDNYIYTGWPAAN